MYQETFVILAIVCGVLSLTLRATPASTSSVSNSKSGDFKHFQTIYLTVYLLLMSSNPAPPPLILVLSPPYPYAARGDYREWRRGRTFEKLKFPFGGFLIGNIGA